MLIYVIYGRPSICLFGFLSIDGLMALAYRMVPRLRRSTWLCLQAVFGGHGKAQRDFDPYLDPLKVGCLLSLVFFFFLFSRANWGNLCMIFRNPLPKAGSPLLKGACSRSNKDTPVGRWLVCLFAVSSGKNLGVSTSPENAHPMASYIPLNSLKKSTYSLVKIQTFDGSWGDSAPALATEELAKGARDNAMKAKGVDTCGSLVPSAAYHTFYDPPDVVTRWQPSRRQSKRRWRPVGHWPDIFTSPEMERDR